MIFAGISSSFFEHIPGIDNSGWHFIAKKWFSVLLLGAFTFPLIIKKQISELSIASALLFSGVILFNLLLIVMKIDKSNKLPYTPSDSKKFYEFKFDQAWLSSLSTVFVAYGFQSGFFPIHNVLKEKTYKNGMKFASYAMVFSYLIYILIMFTGLYSFGTSIKGDVLESLRYINSWESFVLRTIFLLIMLTHTPFVFFIGKESVLCLAVLIYHKFKKHDTDVGDDEEPLLENQNTGDSDRHIKNQRRRKSMANKRK